MNDLEIIGGLYGMNIGNQQFTMRGIKISDAVIVSYATVPDVILRQFTDHNAILGHIPDLELGLAIPRIDHFKLWHCFLDDQWIDKQPTCRFRRYCRQ